MKKQQVTSKTNESKSTSQQGGGTIWRARARQRIAQKSASRRALRTARRLGIGRS